MNLVWLYMIVSAINKREGNADIGYNIDKKKKPVTRNYLLCEFTYMRLNV